MDFFLSILKHYKKWLIFCFQENYYQAADIFFFFFISLGLNYPAALGSAGNYIPIPTYPSFPIQQHPPILWQLVNISGMPAEAIAVPEMVPPAPGAVNFPSSPHISRQSSPSQSASPSRTTSPARKTYHHKVERSNSQPRNKPNYNDYLYQNPPVMSINMSKKNCTERFEGKDINIKSEDDVSFTFVSFY